MNQDFTEKTKYCPKKIHADCFTGKKKSCTSSEQKQFVQAENFPPLSPLIPFLMVRPLF